MPKRTQFLYAVLLILSVLFLTSCATGTRNRGTVCYPGDMPIIYQPAGAASHIVLHGETLYRISKAYNVDVKDLMKANGISDPTQLAVGQTLKIPQAVSPRMPGICLAPSTKWRYIIIHHSATDIGSASGFNKAHLRRGFSRGIGYHFVIDNGTEGRSDGQIEVTRRWTFQRDGAHCKAGGMNHDGIGICLVGNFDRDHVSEAQMKSLVYLVKLLSEHYNISPEHIMGHSMVSGARTHCPGRKFPWGDFRSRL
ncbi:MAG: N-acetylmuramoyl-L-alanine amidase [Candidatus Omnitrophica bacterium]|nr:N-acetylmuramoyl-L-alanine amidase [Candidatus Omnitrophota bacterium]